MEEDGGTVFKGGKNRRTQHMHQNLESCTAAYCFCTHSGGGEREDSTLNTGVIQGKSDESYHMFCGAKTDKIT